MWKEIFGLTVIFLGILIMIGLFSPTRMRKIAELEKNLFYPQKLVDWFIEMRYFASAVALILSGIAFFLSEDNLQLFALLFLSTAIALSNIIFGKIKESIPAEKNILIQMFSDLGILTLLLHFSGGVENPLFISYTFHIFLSTIMLGREKSIWIYLFSLIAFSGLAFLEYKEIIPHHVIKITEYHGELYQSALFTSSVIFTLFLLLTVSFYFSSKLSESLREKTLSEKRLLAELVHASKLAELGEFASVLSHEINNPLTVVVMKTKTLIQETQGDIKKELISIDEHITRILSTTQTILDIVRPKPPEKRYFDIHEAIKSVLKLFELKTRKKDIKIVLNFSEDIPNFYGVQPQIEQVFLNVINNAIDAFDNKQEEEKIIKINTYKTERENKKYICIEITDNGSGIKEEIKDKIFEPFFTTKSRGTGIGLSIVKKIIDEHNGFIEVDSEYLKGTSFKILLPIKDE